MMLLTTTTAWAQDEISGLTYNTEGGYYEINDAQDLVDLATYVNGGNNASGKTFKQTANITLTEATAPIGNSLTQPFKGTYDGGDHSISGLVISNDSYVVGLFGRVDGGTVKNLRLISPNITNTYERSGNTTASVNIGGIAGCTNNGGKIQNCHVISPTFSMPNVLNPEYGNLYYGAILGCYDYRKDRVTGCYYYSDTYGCMGADDINNIIQNCARVYALTLGDGITATADLTIGTANYCKEGTAVTLGHDDPAVGYLLSSYTVNGEAISGNTFTMGTADATVAATFTPDPAHFSQSGDEYTIHTATGWGVFCDALQDNDTYNRFSGKTVKLGANIGTAQNPITRMAGGSDHEFMGTFDGDGHTLTVNYTNTGNDVRTAPFSYVNGATISNLIVGGTISGTAYRAAGIVGETTGQTTITNCVSSVDVSSGRYTGGISIGGLVTIDGCVFDGKIVGTTYSGGFVGYSNEATSISNSLFDPQDGSSISGGTFYYHNAAVTITNCYYTRALGTAQGKAARNIEAGQNVTISAISPVGSPVENGTYSVSGITAYAKGITRTVGQTTTFYYGNEDEVSLTLSNTATGAPLGYQYSAYTASAGTLSGNATDGWTLTMPDEDVTVSVDTDHLRSTGEPVSVSYINAAGETQTAQAIALDGSETSLAAGTYFVGLENVNFDHTVTLGGNVNLILADNCHMNVGTSGEGRINGYGIDGYDPDTDDAYALTITSQSLGDDMGTLSVYTTGMNDGIYTNALTTNGTGIKAYNGNITLGWTNVTDRITANSYYAGGTVNIKSGQIFATDDATPAMVSGTVSYPNTLAGKTLQPYGYSLTANEADGNCWTTFYSSQSGFSIETADAYAYTAVYDNTDPNAPQLTLTKLGTDIPSGTAVIIVSATSPVTLAIDGTLGSFSGDNDLHGVDVRTLKSTLGTGTFYVMGKVNDVFGFYQYTAQYMPARKAYLLVSGSAAPGLKMVFDDEETNSLSPIPSPSREGGAGEWYTLDGRKFDKQPTQKGLYIHGNIKVVIK